VLFSFFIQREHASRQRATFFCQRWQRDTHIYDKREETVEREEGKKKRKKKDNSKRHTPNTRT
jgi:hypothetical protein